MTKNLDPSLEIWMPLVSLKQAALPLGGGVPSQHPIHMTSHCHTKQGFQLNNYPYLSLSNLLMTHTKHMTRRQIQLWLHMMVTLVTTTPPTENSYEWPSPQSNQSHISRTWWACLRSPHWDYPIRTHCYLIKQQCSNLSEPLSGWCSLVLVLRALSWEEELVDCLHTLKGERGERRCVVNVSREKRTIYIALWCQVMSKDCQAWTTPYQLTPFAARLT